MTDEFPELKRVSAKLDKFIQEHVRMKEELLKVKDERDEMSAKRTYMKEQLAVQEKKMLTGRIAENIQDDQSRKALKLRINELVREVDKCISLLNQ
ncbi:MAG TPA: hypothetical protein DDX92_02725 [Flavobacteriales bacterium]|mgnify:CR=1 FL=1|jgi:phage regulator Rha-like protein|nr:hypothetical protein [Flavobacteriales bacterium]